MTHLTDYGIALKRLDIEKDLLDIEKQRLPFIRDQFELEKDRHAFEVERLKLEKRRHKREFYSLTISGLAILISIIGVCVAALRTITVEIKSLASIDELLSGKVS